MARQKKTDTPKVEREKWRGRWPMPEGFSEEGLKLLDERYEITEKWEAGRRRQGPPFNEQFCADVYAIADMMTRDGSFKGKFNPEELYREMCDTMDEMRKGKKEYSLYDEVKMVEKVMDNHRKKTATKK